MLHHSNGTLFYCVHMEYSKNGIPYISSVVWFQIICEPEKYSPYHYRTHNPVYSGAINQHREKIRTVYCGPWEHKY